MFDNHHSQRNGKSVCHIVHTYEALKIHEHVCVVTSDIEKYCKLFKYTTGEQLFYKELKERHYHVYFMLHNISQNAPINQ